MARRRREAGALARSVDGLAERGAHGIPCLDRAAAELARRLDADRARIALFGDGDDRNGPPLAALVLGEVVSADAPADGVWPSTDGRPPRALLSAPVVVFGVPVGTVDVERAGVYSWTVHDVEAAREHAAGVGAALERLLAQRGDGDPGCRSTA